MKKYDEKSLRKLQLTELEILIEIDKICKKNKINYWLDFGTLLGAVRHKGFIPWDDDIDISMLREDYNKFCSICKKELNPNYYLHDFKSDSNYWLPYAKVRKKNTLLDEKNISHLDLQKEIFVDVFPVDNISSRNIKFESKAVNILQTLLLYKINICNNKILNIVLRFIKIEWLHKLIIFFMTKNDKKNSKLLAAYGSIRDINKKIFEKDDFVPVKKLNFEGHLFSVPCKYKKVLTQVYGKDYMQLPPVEKRITHNPVKVSFDTNDENETYYG